MTHVDPLNHTQLQIPLFKNSKMVDGRHFEKSLNRHNSATVGWIGMKFGTLTHFDHLNLLIVKILNF